MKNLSESVFVLPNNVKSPKFKNLDIIKWYSKFKVQWLKDSKKFFNEPGTVKATKEQTDMFISTVREYMKKHADMFNYVAAGSERIAFVTKDNKYCIKICCPFDGYYINQIQNEIQLIQKLNNPICIYSVLDYDELGYSSLLCECCTQATAHDFKNILGIDYKNLCKLSDILSTKCNLKNLQGGLEYLLAKAPDYIKPFISNIIKNTELKFQIIRNWIEIRIKTNNKLRDASNHLENWGVITVNQNKILKIIDAGL